MSIERGDRLVRDGHLVEPVLVLLELLGGGVVGRTPGARDAEPRDHVGHPNPERARRRLFVELADRPGFEAAFGQRRPVAAQLGGKLVRVPAGVACPLECSERDEMCPNVIGVAVSAVLVVGRHNVRSMAPHEPDEPPDGLVDVGLPEAARVQVSRAADHVRIPVAEVLPLRNAELAKRSFELRRPNLAQAPMVLRCVELLDDDLAHLAARARDEHHPMTCRDGLRHGAARPDGLVVRVGVTRHQRQPAPRVGCIGFVHG